MHRKHKSTKVPNVKLRPRPAASSSSLRDAIADEGEASFDQIIQTRNRLRDAEFDREDEASAAAAQDQLDGPLAGANFCFTGVTDDKTALAHAAYQLGAKVEGNLTESTTHLIALNPLSFKYECALSLGLFIILPQFLFDCLDRWKSAQEVDVDTLVRRYTLKPLHNLKIGICGIEDRREREHMKSRLKGLGALLVYPMLIQDDVTHLVCGTADRRASSTLQTVYDLRRGKVGQSDERRAAEQLKCVKTEWVEDCAAVAGRLKEDLYDIWTHRHAPSPAERAQLRTSVPLRTFSECKKRFNNAVLTQRRLSEKLQRIEEEQRRAKIQGQVRREALLKKSLMGVGASKEMETGRGPLRGSPGSNLLSINRAVEESAEPAKPMITTKKPPQEMRQSSVAPPSLPTTGDTAAQRIEAKEPTTARAKDSAKEADPPPTFSSLVMRLDLSQRDKPNQSLIEEALLDCGIQRQNMLSISERSQVAHYCLTSLSGPSVDPWSGYGQPVTTFWLEQCMHYEQVMNPASSSAPPYLRPAGVDLPVEGAAQCVISLTGFSLEDDEPERVQLTKCLRQMGCKITGPFSKKNTHLLSAHPDKQSVPGTKENKACEWGIPVVGAGFIRRMWEHGRIEPPPALGSPSAAMGRSPLVESLPMEETQQTTMPPPAVAPRTSSNLCRDITNQVARSREEKDDVETTDRAMSHESGRAKATGISNDGGARPGTRTDACEVADRLMRPIEQLADSPIPEERSHPCPLPAPPRAEVSDTQASSLAGQSMWATRMEGEVTAFLAARKRSNSSHASPADGHGERPETSDGFGGDTVHLPATSSGGTKRRGKLPPKSRRSASGQVGATAASPAPGRRNGSISPTKAGSVYEGEGEEGQEQDAAQILLAHRELAAAHAESSVPSATEGDGHIGRQPSHYSVHGFSAEEEDEKEVDGSMKITYRDPQAERERRRLEELVGGRVPKVGGSNKRSREESSNASAAATATTAAAAHGEEEESNSEMDILGRAEPVFLPPRGQESPSSKKRIVARKQPGMGR